MSALNLNPSEVEQDRLRRAIAFVADDGEDWADHCRPGSFGCHELLDRTALCAEMIEQHIQAHPSCVANPEWFLLAERAAAALRELYQQVGAEHLSA